jgi:hypothetical protein
MMGAAWATLLSYAVMAGGGFHFSQTVYPIPFRYARLARTSAAGLATYALSWLAPSQLLWGVAFKAAAYLAFPLVLWLFGVWSWAEVRALRRAGSAEAA